MKKKIAIFLFLLTFIFSGICYGGTTISDSNDNSDKSVQTINVSSGIPDVTPDAATNKVKRVVMAFYVFAAELSPYITLFIVVVCGLIGFFFREVRSIAFWAVVGMAVVFLAPKLIGLFNYLKNA